MMNVNSTAVCDAMTVYLAELAVLREMGIGAGRLDFAGKAYVASMSKTKPGRAIIVADHSLYRVAIAEIGCPVTIVEGAEPRESFLLGTEESELNFVYRDCGREIGFGQDSCAMTCTVPVEYEGCIVIFGTHPTYMRYCGGLALCATITWRNTKVGMNALHSVLLE
jgi:hypothetical protein